MLATDRWMLGAGFLAKGWSVNDSDPGQIAAVRDQLIATKNASSPLTTPPSIPSSLPANR
jgi:hypothetical protein